MVWTAYRRVPEPGACPFCLVLATRGAVYTSETTAGGSANRYHAHCRCEPEAETQFDARYDTRIPAEDANRTVSMWNRPKSQGGRRYTYDLRTFRGGRVQPPPAPAPVAPVSGPPTPWQRGAWAELTPDDVVAHLLPDTEDRLLAKIRESQRAAMTGRIKHGWRNGEHVIVSEVDLSEREYTGLLADFDDVLDGLPADINGQRIDVIIPAKDRHMKGGMVGGYVVRGTRVVKLNPKLARGEKWGTVGHQAPAFDPTQARKWVLTHETGHVVDNIREDTMTARGKVKPKETGWHRSTFKTVEGGWRYGRSKTVEGYAEAYAEYHVGGPGNPVADAYARRYRW